MISDSSRLVSALALLLLLGAPACIRPEEQPEPQLAAAPGPDPAIAAHAAILEQEVARLRQELDARAAGDQLTSVAHADMVHRLDELAAMNNELGERLRTAGQNVEQLAVERKNLTEALATARTRLEVLEMPAAAPAAAPPAPAQSPMKAAAEKSDAEHKIAGQPAD